MELVVIFHFPNPGNSPRNSIDRISNCNGLVMNEPSTLIPYPTTSPDPLLIVRPIVDPEERFTECKNLLYDNDLTALSALLVGDSSISFVDYQDSGGQTLLHVACFQGHANAVDLLIKLGANIELKNLEDRLPIGRNINVATIVLSVSCLSLLLSCY